MTVNHADTTRPDIITDNATPYRPVDESGGDRPLSVALVEAVEAATGIDAVNLPPLHDTIDPDALNALARSTDQSLRITFEYADLTVTISDDRGIAVTNPDDI